MRCEKQMERHTPPKTATDAEWTAAIWIRKLARIFGAISTAAFSTLTSSELDFFSLSVQVDKLENTRRQFYILQS